MKTWKLVSLGLSLTILGSVSKAQIVTFQEMKEAIANDYVERGYYNKEDAQKEASNRAKELLEGSELILKTFSAEQVKQINKTIVDAQKNESYQKITYEPTRKFYEVMARFRLQNRLALDTFLQTSGFLGNASLTVEYAKPYYGNDPKEYQATVKKIDQRSRKGHTIVSIKPYGQDLLHFVATIEGSQIQLTGVRPAQLEHMDSDGNLRSVYQESLDEKPSFLLDIKERTLTAKKSATPWYSYSRGSTSLKIRKQMTLSCKSVF